MKDLYLGDILDGELYETFDGREIYINEVRDNYCVGHERDRGSGKAWNWDLRTISYLRRNIRTIIEML